MARSLFILYLLTFSHISSGQENPVEIWNSDKTASASCVLNKFPTCQVVLNGKAIDVTKVTYSNIGKLGTLGIVDYEKVVTEPIEWLKNTNDIQLISFRTQAWRNKQRFTIVEPVLIKNGKYLPR